jgi:poly-gamma-glutamate capsule biosynthesis protein CapA/YwtB (metallophosphatase superfamily)
VIGNKTRLGFGAAALAAVGILWWQLGSKRQVTVRGSGDLLTIAATGDSLVLKPMPSSKSDRGVEGVTSVLENASIAVTNLEENLLDAARVPRADNPGEMRWPYGTKRTAQDLRQLGFTMVSLANNHAIDYGVDGLGQTLQILDRAGLLHAGAGEDLAQARAPVLVGSAPRRVALIAVATSASPESRATPLRGEILGRPGVSALRYAPDVTVDAKTFATLKQSPVASAASKTSGNELVVSGKAIRKGERTVVEMLADQGDTNEILGQIRQARAEADYVLLTVHSHEPSNQSQAPAEFLKRFARAAIDAGASMVIGQGPHQLRGIEVYKSGVIFYSLGNFEFDFSRVDPRSEDAYEAGVDLYRLALGAVADSEPPPPQSADNPLWWESVIAVGHFDRGVLRSVRLQPIDLGVDLPLSQRGTPRLASADRSKEILSHLADLSREFSTRMRIENGIGVIELAEPKR